MQISDAKISDIDNTVFFNEISRLGEAPKLSLSKLFGSSFL